MVKQYPDHITIQMEQGEPVQVEGEWTKPEPTVFESDCRAEPNRSNAVIKTGDGAEVYFDFNVFLPKTSVIFPIGSKFTLTKHDGLEVQGLVKRAHNGQLNSRIWV